ncbi:MAG TPA: Holliday junction branch migration protein RuvA [Thermotogota bacterium]|nr:Holliday junction branch migration protein RuvA [Thermotogota bacterium]HPJ88696.1 Holliday junction branch migration protein RuvA [Thermotogota bacterium]HPR95955.1 Holliday junction branch migration protein RuvA [Thermotogota bacterium]
MYNYLIGIITEREEDNRITLEVNNIGYNITADNELYNCGIDPVKAFVVMIPGDDEFKLFGFLNKTNKKLFNLLRSVSGLGPKTAIKMLSVSDSVELIEAITLNDSDFLKKLPGIGKKTAERIILELRTKMKDLTSDNDLIVDYESDSKISSLTIFQESLEGLTALGYPSGKSRLILRELMSLNEDYTVQQLIKDALKKFLEMKK